MNRSLESRKGVATLELVLCMPVLLVLMVGIVWLGFSVVGQSQVAVEARHNAWQKRFEESSSEPLRFLEDDFATEDATTEVRISPLLDDVAPPESSHDVGVGNWDHENTDLNRAPSWELYATAAVNAKTGGLQNAYSDARNTLGPLQQQSGQAIVDALTNIIRDALENPLDRFKGGADNADRANKQKAEQEKRDITRDIDRTKAEIEETKELIKELKDQRGEAEDDKEKDSLKARIKMNENKLDRLKAKKKRLESDRRKMD